MATVYADAVARNVSGGKKREPHDVVPVRVRQEYVEQCLRSRPCCRSTRLPNSRTPVPRSQSTYSSPPVMISTQLVLPPKVPRTENGSAWSIKASIASGVSSTCPRAASSASRILARTARSRSGAGNEPRVPQKRTRSGSAARSRYRRGHRPSGSRPAPPRRRSLPRPSQRSGRDARTG